MHTHAYTLLQTQRMEKILHVDTASGKVLYGPIFACIRFTVSELDCTTYIKVMRLVVSFVFKPLGT